MMKFELTKSSHNNQWYWRLIAPNGQIVAVGGEGYVQKADAVHGINLTKGTTSATPVYEQRPDGNWFQH